MAHISVKAPQLRPDADLLPQDAREHAARGGALEAPEAPTRVRASSALVAAGHELAAVGGEAQ
jgi:hypothetical protein